MAVSSRKTAFGQAVSYALSKVGKPEMVLKNELWRPYAYNFYMHEMEAYRFPSTWQEISAPNAAYKISMFCFHGGGVFYIFKWKAEVAAILQSDLAARRGRIFSAYFSINCLLHISINHTENVMDLYVYAQTIDTRRSSLIFQAPGYEANSSQIQTL